MSDRFGHRSGRPRIVVRETDDYVEHGPERPPAEPEKAWVHNLFQPITFALLVACVIWPIAQLASGISPNANPVPILSMPVLMALVGFATQRMVVRRLLSGTDALRFRFVELGILFLLTKVTSLADDTLVELIDGARAWSANPLTFFDTQTMITFVMGGIAWWTGAATARDFDAVRDPSLYLGELGPRQRLTRRYFAGGAALMLFAAFNRVDLLSVVTLTQERSRAPVVSALIYFLAGLVMLGQVRLSRMLSLWHRDRVAVSTGLGANWLRYLLITLAIAAGIAFILPTGYAVGLLDLARFLLQLLMSLLMLLYILITWPLSWLASLILGKPAPAPPAEMSRLPLEPEMAASDAGGGLWWAILRSAIFWLVLSAAVITLLRSYFRDHPGLGEFLHRVAPLRWATSLWSAFWRWLKGMGRKAGRVVPNLVARLRRARAVRQAARLGSRPSAPREQVLHHYLSTLDVASAEGVPRRTVQTPYEYRHKLDDRLEEEQEAVAELTEAFVEARYSDHAITADEATAQQANADRVQQGLRRRSED